MTTPIAQVQFDPDVEPTVSGPNAEFEQFTELGLPEAVPARLRVAVDPPHNGVVVADVTVTVSVGATLATAIGSAARRASAVWLVTDATITSGVTKERIRVQNLVTVD
jgi:hypothetical protein